MDLQTVAFFIGGQKRSFVQSAYFAESVGTLSDDVACFDVECYWNPSCH